MATDLISAVAERASLTFTDEIVALGYKVWRFILLLSLSLVPATVIAQTLVDPTKPPAELSARAGEETVESNELQSIIISPTRRAAIINGQTVELGGKTGDVRLIEVSETGVVLQGAKGRQVLTMFPNVKLLKKSVFPLMEDEERNPVRKEMLVNKPDSQFGKKEEK
jgi:MSHA biogenesis protein MshK